LANQGAEKPGVLFDDQARLDVSTFVSGTIVHQVTITASVPGLCSSAPPIG
jgi:hypothetical protein